MERQYFSLAPVSPQSMSLRVAQCLVILLETSGTRQQIAQLMGISCRTVDVYMDNLREKLGCKNRHELIEKGLLCDWAKWSKEIKLIN